MPGLPDGDDDLDPSAVVVREGVARLHSNNAPAGGTARLLEGVRRTVAAGVSPANAAKRQHWYRPGFSVRNLSSKTYGPADDVMTDAGFGLHVVLRSGRRI
ncbi:hypothetical protein [Arthrobacter sp. UYEF3]|uniref:hypothetical protein n=1 Tax=Arthrobacter sp. UYEF3 TaxID=1756365 RepID=UPI0033961C5C